MLIIPQKNVTWGEIDCHDKMVNKGIIDIFLIQENHTPMTDNSKWVNSGQRD